MSKTEAIADKVSKNLDKVFEEIFLINPDTTIPINIAGINVMVTTISARLNQPLADKLIKPKTQPEKKKAFKVGRTFFGGLS